MTISVIFSIPNYVFQKSHDLFLRNTIFFLCSPSTLSTTLKTGSLRTSFAIFDLRFKVQCGEVAVVFFCGFVISFGDLGFELRISVIRSCLGW
jgi:hypothetical protein